MPKKRRSRSHRSSSSSPSSSSSVRPPNPPSPIPPDISSLQLSPPPNPIPPDHSSPQPSPPPIPPDVSSLQLSPPIPPDLSSLQLSPPHHQHTDPGPSASSRPPTLALPLGWTDADCFILCSHMYENSRTFDDSSQWWRKIAPHFPGKTVQELRLFGYLYMTSYRELAADRGWILPNVQQTRADFETGLPSMEQCQLLRILVEENPEILTSDGGWEELAGFFPGRIASGIRFNIKMVLLNAYHMWNLNAIGLRLRQQMRAASSQADAGDPQASTSAQGDDSDEEI